MKLAVGFACCAFVAFCWWRVCSIGRRLRRVQKRTERQELREMLRDVERSIAREAERR
jgi:hypothetical protein